MWRRRAQHRSLPADPRSDGQADFPDRALGSGHAMKAINNYVSAAGLVAAAEGCSPPSASALDPGNVVDILKRVDRDEQFPATSFISSSCRARSTPASRSS